MRHFALAAGLTLALFSGVASAATSPSTISAPGRVAIDVNGGVIADDVDGGGADFTVALPDGGALLIGHAAAATPYVEDIARIDRAGALVTSFGTGGVARVDLTAGKLMVSQVLRRPDGRLLLVGSGSSLDKYSPGQLEIAQLSPEGVIDPSFGNGGFAIAGMNTACGGGCAPAALQSDGRIVITGETGQLVPLPAPGNYSGLRWVMGRLTANGAPDTTFGTGGTITFPQQGGAGMNVAVLGDGRIVGEGQVSTSSPPATINFSTVLTRLLSDGTPDPAFNSGAPLTAPFAYGNAMLPEPDGSVLLAGRLAGSPTPPFTTGDQLLVRYTPAGALDPAFGTTGVANLGNATVVSQLLPGPGDTTLAVTNSEPTALAPSNYKPFGGVVVRGIAANGVTNGYVSVPLPFGGGGSSFLVSKLPRPLPSILQNTFRSRVLTPRPDGSYIIGGGVTVSTPTGEGVGRDIFRFAAMSLTSKFVPDPAFGGPVVKPKVTTNLPHQRGSTAHTRHGIRVRIVSSGVGLARVLIKSGGHTIAQSVVPIFHTGAQTLPIELTKTGNTLLRHISHHVRVSISVSMRDVFVTAASATAVGNLR